MSVLKKLKEKLPTDSPLLKEPRKGPLWKGPEVDGITYSLLSRFLVCRERFRCLVVEGLRPAEEFNHRLEFGSMWHVCEESLAAGQSPTNRVDQWTPLVNYVRELCRKYPLQREQIYHWYQVCLALFPVYVEHWSKHPDVTERTPLLQEQVFDVPYKLPSGRIVRLRGKWDSVDLIGKGKEAGIYLQENKTKSQIDGAKITRQLNYDLQTMMYLVALSVWKTKWQNGEIGSGKGVLQLKDLPLKGVRYNVIRRSSHKTPESMMKKVFEDRESGRIGEWFARWKVEITPADITRFRNQCLNPILEQLCDWWEWITKAKDPFSPNDGCETPKDKSVHSSIHWTHPFGVYNILDEGGSTDLDNYLETGSELGLTRADNLFPELTNADSDETTRNDRK